MIRKTCSIDFYSADAERKGISILSGSHLNLIKVSLSRHPQVGVGDHDLSLGTAVGPCLDAVFIKHFDTYRKLAVRNLYAVVNHTVSAGDGWDQGHIFNIFLWSRIYFYRAGNTAVIKKVKSG